MTVMTSGQGPVEAAAASDIVLEVEGLQVDYGAGEGALRAVNDVDLVLRRGEVLGIAGESGSGKSTLAFAMTRLLRPPGMIGAGNVTYHQRNGTTIDILGMTDDELQAFRWSEIAIVFQNAMSALNPVMTIRSQMLDVFVAHRPEMGKAARLDRMRELLSIVGISPDRATAYPHELSGGMRQRAMIAIALALEPEIVIMDEPTTALDVVMQQQILAELMTLRDRLGFSIIFITHDLSLLLEVADSIAVMYAGRVVEMAPASHLYRAPRHPYSDGLLHSFPLLRGARQVLTGIPGAPPDLRAMPAGCSFRPRCAHAVPDCRSVDPELGPTHIAGDAPERRVACLLYDGAHGSPPERLG